MIDSGEPECYKDVMQVESRKKREKGMNEEMESLVRNHTWDFVHYPIEKGHCRINGFAS